MYGSVYPNPNPKQYDSFHPSSKSDGYVVDHCRSLSYHWFISSLLSRTDRSIQRSGDGEHYRAACKLHMGSNKNDMGDGMCIVFELDNIEALEVDSV